MFALGDDVQPAVLSDAEIAQARQGRRAGIGGVAEGPRAGAGRTGGPRAARSAGRPAAATRASRRWNDSGQNSTGSPADCRRAAASSPASSRAGLAHRFDIVPADEVGQRTGDRGEVHRGLDSRPNCHLSLSESEPFAERKATLFVAAVPKCASHPSSKAGEFRLGGAILHPVIGLLRRQFGEHGFEFIERSQAPARPCPPFESSAASQKPCRCGLAAPREPIESYAVSASKSRSSVGAGLAQGPSMW